MNTTKNLARKIYLPLVISLIIGFGAGMWVSQLTAPGKHVSVNAEDGQAAEQEILYWVAPMDPDYRRDGPGKSPMGMDLVPVYAEQEPEILYWVAPMDPDYRRDGPGKSPMGMDLVPVYA